MAKQFFSVPEIRTRYNSFDKQFGVDTTPVDIELIDRDGAAVACCWMKSFYVSGSSSRSYPYLFEFNLHYLVHMLPKDWDDVVKHEYAHAVATIRTGRDCRHNQTWQKICAQIGCRPYPYTYNMAIPEPPLEGGVKGSVPIQCLRCGHIVMQSEDSRTVSMLRAGKSAWNTVCPKCGGMLFALIDG